MALQTLTSSSTASGPAQTTSSQPVVPQLDSRNSIPFSFLVAFLALFVGFMVLGLWARRIIYYIRLRLGLPIPEPRPKGVDTKPKKPVLWDVYPEKSRQVKMWCHMEPLSCWYRREAPPIVPDLPSTPTGTRPMTRPHTTPTNGGGVILMSGARMRTPVLPPPPVGPPPIYRYRGIIDQWQELFKPKVKSADSERKIEAMRVAVFVAMPSQSTRRRRSDEKSEARGSTDSSEFGAAGEVALGIAEVPWEHDPSLFDGKGS